MRLRAEDVKVRPLSARAWRRLRREGILFHQSPRRAQRNSLTKQEVRMEFSNIILEKKGKVATITLNRPQSLNGLSNELIGEIDVAI